MLNTYLGSVKFCGSDSGGEHEKTPTASTTKVKSKPKPRIDSTRNDERHGRSKKRASSPQTQTTSRSPKVQKTNTKDVTSNMRENRTSKTTSELHFQGNDPESAISISDAEDDSAVCPVYIDTSKPSSAIKLEDESLGSRGISPASSSESIERPLENGRTLDQEKADLIKTLNTARAELIQLKEKSRVEGEKLTVIERNYHSLQAELEAEQRKTQELDAANAAIKSALEREQNERSKLIKQINVLQAECEEAKQKFDPTELRALKQGNDALTDQLRLEQSQRARDLEEIDDITIERNEANSKLTAMEALRSTNKDLVAQLNALKAIKERTPSWPDNSSDGSHSPAHTLTPLISAKSSLSSVSSTASSSVSDLQKRYENIKSTYIAVKGKYDNMCSIFEDLSNTTDGMNLRSFGRFGEHMKKLKGAVEQSKAERTGHRSGGVHGSTASNQSE